MLKIDMKVAKKWNLIMKEYQKVFPQRQEKQLKINFLSPKSMPKNWKKNWQSKPSSKKSLFEKEIKLCLMKNKFSPEMSKQCQEQLTRRQKIVVQNIDADRTLIRACRKDILQNECRKELRGNAGMSGNDIQLASLMLCLERAVKDGSGLEPECRAELMENRKMLMTDYQLNPNIVKLCKDEIANHCNGGIERGGKTLHCLLNKAAKSKIKIANLTPGNKIAFSDACFAEVCLKMFKNSTIKF